MQIVSPELKARLQNNLRSQVFVVEFYKPNAKPTANGFDPAGGDFLFGAAKTPGLVFRGREYLQLLDKIGEIKRISGKQLSSLSFSLSNSTREVVAFERETGFEGCICVVRLIDRTLLANLADSMVEFTGRCKRPSSFKRSSETASISAEQILNQTQVLVPRRKFAPEDAAGRVPSDPLFEGFRFQQRNGSVTYTEIVKKRFLFFFSKKKRITQTLQYSSHSDLSGEQVVPLALGRVQMEALQLAYEDVGTNITGTAAWCEGEIAQFINVRSVTPGLTIQDMALKRGLLGGVGEQTNDDPGWVGAGTYSRTAYIRYSARGSQVDSDDPAPQLVSVILGMKVPLPDASGNFTLFDWTDNPVYLTRWFLNSKDYFGLSDEWFDNAELVEEASYCNQILVDQSNTDLVLLNNSQTAIAGTDYKNYAPTGTVSPAYWKSQSGENTNYSQYSESANYQFYNNSPVLDGDWNGDGIRDYAAPPTNYRRRSTLNVVASEQTPAIDFLYDVKLPAFGGFITQKANGKLSIRVKRPVDFAFVSAANTVGASEILVKNINPFRAQTGKILIGANLPTSEVRRVTYARYDTAVSVSISASGGASVSSATLTGGSTIVPPSSTVTVSTVTGQKSVIIDGYGLYYQPSADDTAYTVAAIMAAQVNSHNELNKYVKAVWQPGSPTFTVESRVGFLELNNALEYVHNVKIPNPTAAPVVANSAGNLQGGAYLITYSFITLEGETLTGGLASQTVGTGGGVYCYPVSLPARATAVRWYASTEANGYRMRFVFENNGAGWIMTDAPKRGAKGEPAVNSTAAECHRIAMAFSDKADSRANLQRSNMLKGSFEFPLGGESSTNEVKGKYREAAQDFQLTELKIKDAAHIAKINKTNSKEINLAAVDNYHQAFRRLNQELAILRDGDTFYGWSSDGEALLLEEGDVVAITDDSGLYRNEPARIENISLTESENGYPQISFTARKYRRSYYDDQVTEKLVPLDIIINTNPNTEQGAPGVWQYSAATNTTVEIGVNNYTDNAKFRKILVANAADMAGAAVSTVTASDFQNNLLPQITRITKAGVSAAVTKYIQVFHSSNNVTFSTGSNVLGIAFAAADGTGGTTGTPSGGGGTTTNPGDPGGSCFTGKTLFKLFGGEEIPFLELYKNRNHYIGKYAKSYDKENEAWAGRITDILMHEVNEYLEVGFSNGTTVEVTREHPFLTVSNEYVAIGKLIMGDNVRTDTQNEIVKIVSIKLIKKETQVFNATIAHYQNYVANGLRVHNRKDATVDGAVS